MLPLVKRDDWVEYKVGRKSYTHKCFNSNPNTVWVEDDKGKILKLHKLKNFIKVVEEPLREKGGKPNEVLDNLMKKLVPSSTTSSSTP